MRAPNSRRPPAGRRRSAPPPLLPALLRFRNWTLWSRFGRVREGWGEAVELEFEGLWLRAWGIFACAFGGRILGFPSLVELGSILFVECACYSAAFAGSGCSV